MKVLVCNNVTKRFRQQLAVNDVTLTVQEGDIYGLVGENGAGKSTLIKLVTKILNLTSGRCELFETGNMTIGAVSAVIENPAVYPYLSAWDNIKNQFLLFGRKDFDQIGEIMKLVGIEYLIKNNKKATQFSLGMKQRLGIAMALVSRPKFVILDEPTNGLDPEGIVELRQLILRLNKEGITFIISSHILTELSKIATRYGIVHKGKLVKEITANEIILDGKPRTTISVGSTAGLEDLLKKLELTNYTLNGSELELSGEFSYAKLFAGLEKNNIPVLSVTSVKESIEDYYLKLMGESHV